MTLTSVNSIPITITEQVFLLLDVENYPQLSKACKLFREIILKSQYLQANIKRWIIYQYICKKIPDSIAVTVPSFESLTKWKKFQDRNETAGSTAQKTFTEICGCDVQKQILSLSEREIKELALRGESLLIGLVALFNQKANFIQQLLQLSPSIVKNPLIKEDLYPMFREAISELHEIAPEFLDLFVSEDSAFTIDELKILVERASYSKYFHYIFLMIEKQAFPATKESFLAIHSRFSFEWIDHGYALLFESGFPVHYDYLCAQNNYDRLKYHSQWEKEEINYLVNAGLKFYDSDLLDLLINGGPHTPRIVDSMIAAGALHPEAVDRALDWIIRNNTKNENSYFRLHLSVQALQLLIETNGIDLSKRNIYKQRIQDLLGDRRENAYLKEIIEIISHAEKYLEEGILSKKFQQLVSPDHLHTFINSKKQIRIHSHDLSYALRFKYPLKTIQLLLDKGAPIEELHLAVSLQWNCDLEIVRTIIQKISPRIYHLNCALKHRCSAEVIRLFLDYWRNKEVQFRNYQLTNVLNNAIEWDCSEKIIDLLIKFGAKLNMKHPMNKQGKSSMSSTALEHLPRSV